MNICAVITSDYYEALENAARNTECTLLDVFVEGADKREITTAINNQMNGKPDIFIFDMSVQLENVWKNIHRTKFTSPKTRTIIIGDEDKNPLYTRFIQAGIYDIIIVSDTAFVESQIEAAIKFPADYATATKHMTVTEDEQPQKVPRLTRQNQTTQTLVVENRTIGNIVIAVASVLPRTGSTTLSIAIARYLAEKGLRVALWMDKQEHLVCIQEAYEDIREIESNHRFELDKVMFCAGIDVTDIGDYQYIVLDLGNITDEKLKEFKRSTIKIILSGAKDWEMRYIEEFLKKGITKNDPIDTYHYGFVHTDTTLFSEIAKSMEKKSCMQVPFINDPFKTGADVEKVLEPILGNYLPGEQKKHKEKFSVRSIFRIRVRTQG